MVSRHLLILDNSHFTTGPKQGILLAKSKGKKLSYTHLREMTLEPGYDR